MTDTHPDSDPTAPNRKDDERSDIEQAVMALRANGMGLPYRSGTMRADAATASKSAWLRAK